MVGTHPAAEDGIVLRSVTFKFYSDTWSTQIGVLQCAAGFYLYHLPTPPTVRLTYANLLRALFFNFFFYVSIVSVTVAPVPTLAPTKVNSKSCVKGSTPTCLFSLVPLSTMSATRMIAFVTGLELD